MYISTLTSRLTSILVGRVTSEGGSSTLHNVESTAGSAGACETHGGAGVATPLPHVGVGRVGVAAERLVCIGKGLQVVLHHVTSGVGGASGVRPEDGGGMGVGVVREVVVGAVVILLT